jgi:two-component system response regulator PilR (NtrC family)
MEKGSLVDNKYRVEASLGGGSFSEVFVVDGPNGRSALKLLRKGVGGETSSETIADFKHEFAILKDLNHPNIARILDFGYDRQRKQYYYTSELVNGQNIFDATEGSSVDETLELFVQTLRAFNYLHSYRVHHFDVKAANILVTKEQSQVKVIDFGLASIDPQGKMIGTPSYMAPEIIAREKPDGRADLYSLGVLFYSCLARQNPFRGEGIPETLRNQQTLIPPPASKFCPDLPSFLDKILGKLLEKNPANRYSHAEEILREINFYSAKKFPLETRKTLLSYLPEEGRLIGRKKEIDLFENCFRRVFLPESAENLVILLVIGDRGTGKSRLLKEFKYFSQLKGIPVVSASVRTGRELAEWLSKFRSHLTQGEPTLFLLDDLEACAGRQEFSGEFRGALARILFADKEDRLPLLLVGTAPSLEAIPEPLREILPEWVTCSIAPFRPDELKEYIVSLTGLEDPPQGFLKGLRERTEGNPLLVTELLRSLIEEGGLFDQAGRWRETTFEDIGIDFSKARLEGVLEEILAARYEKLSLPLKGLLAVFAVAGFIFYRDLEKFSAGDDLNRLLEELLEKELVIRDEAGRYGIRNAMLAELICQKMPSARRQALHDQAARLLTILDADPEKRLYHEIRGSDPKRSFELCLKTGERYLQEARGKEATEFFRFALGLPLDLPVDQQVNLRLKLGEASLISLDYPSALSTFQEVEKILTTLKDKTEGVHFQADTLLKVGAVYLKMGELERSRNSLAAALALLRFLKGDRARELVAENLRGAILMQEGRIEEARELFERTRRLWETELSPEEKKKVTNNDLGMVCLASQEYPQALRQFQSDLEFQKTLGDRLLLARTHYNLGETCLGLKEFPSSIEHYQKTASLAQELKNTELLLRAYNGLGNAFNLMGKSEEAVRYYERGLDLCERTGDLRSHAAILVNVGIIEASRGEWKKAARRLEPAIAFLRSIKGRLAIDRQILVRALLEEGDLSRKEKRWEEAEKTLREALRVSEEEEGHPLRFWILKSLIELFSEKGETEEVNRLMAEIKKTAQTPEEIREVSQMSDKTSLPSDFRARLGEIRHDVGHGADPSNVVEKAVRLATEMSSKLEQYETLIHTSLGLETKYNYEAIVSRSKPMVEIFRLLDKITETDLSVFIHGESGTGKELIARALHFNSGRAKKRFVAVNCGALPANLIESELFGYKAGAFTGAARDKKGLFEEADGGTIFLDEVAEIEPALQAKLLRAVQEGEFFRLGDSQPVKADVRVLSASNKDIGELAKERKFREDLYYRLCQIRIDLPPLRERREDIPLLVDHFIRQEAGKPMKVSSRLLKAFMEYEWPGNIRELENLVKVAVALSEGGVIAAKSIPSNYGVAKMLGPHPPQPSASGGHPLPRGERGPLIDSKNNYDPAKNWYDYEKVILAKAYQANTFNARKTAEMLGLSLATVYKKMKEIGLSEKDHPLYHDPFHYERGKRLKDYLKPVFQAALAYSKDKPYAAIARLKVSQGYFYKVMKG